MKMLISFFMLILSFSVDGKPKSQGQENMMVITNNSEHETSKMMFAGIGLIAYMVRRRFHSI